MTDCRCTHDARCPLRRELDRMAGEIARLEGLVGEVERDLTVTRDVLGAVLAS